MNRLFGQAVHEQSDFWQSGDSRSWLIDASHCVAGLLFCSLTGLCGPSNQDQPRTGTSVNAGLGTFVAEVQNILPHEQPRDIAMVPLEAHPAFSIFHNPLWRHHDLSQDEIDP